VKEVAAVEPKVTAVVVVLVKPSPLMATIFSPTAAPEVGLIVVTVGGGIVDQEN